MGKDHMSGGIIKKLKRIDNKTIYCYLRNGDILDISAVMCDYDDCCLKIKKINNRKDEN